MEDLETIVVVSQVLPVVEKESVQEIGRMIMNGGALAFNEWLEELKKENEWIYNFIAVSTMEGIPTKDVRRHMENMVGLYKLLKLQLERDRV